MLVHGTAIAINGRAVLLTGPSNSGKSDLALRAIADGASLVADDLVELICDGGVLQVMRPANADPLIAVRGIGMIAPDRSIDCAALCLCAELNSADHVTSLTPHLGKAGPWLGLFVPQIMLNSFEASALIKLNLALTRFGF